MRTGASSRTGSTSATVRTTARRPRPRPSTRSARDTGPRRSPSPTTRAARTRRRSPWTSRRRRTWSRTTPSRPARPAGEPWATRRSGGLPAATAAAFHCARTRRDRGARAPGLGLVPYGITDEPNSVQTAASAGTSYHVRAWVRAELGVALLSLVVRESGGAYFTLRSSSVRIGTAWSALDMDYTTRGEG